MNLKSEFVLKALATENFRGLCQEYGISPKTGYKWKERFLADGLGGLADRSTRPQSSPAGLPEEVVCEIVRIKQLRAPWGPRKVREIYLRKHGLATTPSESSFKRVLERAGLVEKRRLRAREQSGRLSSDRRAAAPNEVWTVDFKGRWHGQHGARCEPLTVRDEHSRYLLELRTLDSASTERVRAAFERLFEKHGLPQAIRSDNGAPFAHCASLLGLTRLSAWWLVLGIDLERGRPGCPQDNGGHERLHADITRELEWVRLGEDQATLDTWRKTFNEERPHEAIGMRMPAEVYANSTRRYAGTPHDLTYENMRTLKVRADGCLCGNGKLIFVSTALAGWSVGLQPAQESRWTLWFGRLRIGQIDPLTRTFEPAIPSGGKPYENAHS